MARARSACANGKGEDVHGLVNRLSDHIGHGLNFQANGPSLLDGACIVDDFHCRFCGRALHFEAAEFVDVVGQQANMTHYRDACVRDSLDHIEFFSPALKFQGICATFLHHADGIFDGHIGCCVGSVGHGDDAKGVGGTAANGTRVFDHLIHRHRQRVLMPIQRHAKTIAYANNIDPGTFSPCCRKNFANRHHD